MLNMFLICLIGFGVAYCMYKLLMAMAGREEDYLKPGEKPTRLGDDPEVSK